MVPVPPRGICRLSTEITTRRKCSSVVSVRIRHSNPGHASVSMLISYLGGWPQSKGQPRGADLSTNSTQHFLVWLSSRQQEQEKLHGFTRPVSLGLRNDDAL